MTASTKRNTILLSLACAVLAAGAFYYYHRKAGPPIFSPIANVPTGPPPALLSLLPSDAPVILYMDLAALRAASFSGQLAALAPEPAQERDYTEFVRATGFDYARDLDRIAIAAWPRSAGTAMVAVTEGRFDHDKIRQYALRSGTATRQGNSDIYETRGGRPGDTMEMTFLGDNRLALAQGRGLDALLHGSPPGHSDDSLVNRANKVSGASFFLIARADAVPADVWASLKNSAQLERLVRSVRFVTLAGQPEGKNLNAALDAECDSAGNAFQLSSLLESLRWLGRAALSAPDTRRQMPPQALALLDTLLRVTQVSREGKTIQMRVALTPAMLNNVLQPHGRKNPS